MTRVTISLTTTNHALIEQLAQQKHIPVWELVRDVVDIYCAEQRQAVRLRMPHHHYTMRTGDDYTEAE